MNTHNFCLHLNGFTDLNNNRQAKRKAKLYSHLPLSGAGSLDGEAGGEQIICAWCVVMGDAVGDLSSTSTKLPDE